MTEDGGRSTKGLNTNELLLAILTVLVDQREQVVADRPGQARTEILLANAGLSHGTIAQLLGKNADAVRMMITRAKKSAVPATGKAKPGRNPASSTEGSDDAREF